MKYEHCMPVQCAVQLCHICLRVYRHISAMHNAALPRALRKHEKHLHSRYWCAIVPRTWLRCLVLQMSARQVKPQPVVHLRTLTHAHCKTFWTCRAAASLLCHMQV